MFCVQIIADFVNVEIVAKIKIPADERLKKQAQSDLKREQAIDIWRKKMPLKDIRTTQGLNTGPFAGFWFLPSEVNPKRQ